MIGEPRLHVAECDSTQALLDAEGPEGAIATADHQTAGRGRRGRPWLEAAATAVLCSVRLRPHPQRPAPQLSLVGGLAAAAACEEALGRPTAVKWPNDVLVDGQKVAGVLAEARGDAVILGIGINVNQTAAQLPPDARLPAASLRTVDGRERDREDVLAALLRHLDSRYAAWQAAGLEALHDEVTARDYLRGRAVAIGGVAGTAAGIDRDGRLIVRTASGAVAVESGEVSFG